MKRLLPCLLLLTLAAANAFAQDAPAPKPAPAPAPGGLNVKILWYGVIDNGEDEQDAEERRKQTERVPARVGVTFGYAFSITGLPEGSKVTLKQVARYPRARRNAETGATQVTDEADTDCVVGKACLTSYSLEADDEVIGGDWNMELYYQGRKVGEQKFVLRYDGI